ncbi:hypothetical protein RJ641_032408 [Dillenia turbinata]|uniref:Uncharacterized protein n=1 Tax=Dillenia turbinata TaxID=194707 RepID=A0AAN8VRL2_9MAGN
METLGLWLLLYLGLSIAGVNADEVRKDIVHTQKTNATCLPVQATNRTYTDVVINNNKRHNGGGGYSWGWGGGGGGGCGSGWGWGGGGGGWWGWGCRGQAKSDHNHKKRAEAGKGEYKIGEFAQCMNKGRCRGMRLDCPLHCGGPCFYDCRYMCKAHCHR